MAREISVSGKARKYFNNDLYYAIFCPYFMYCNDMQESTYIANLSRLYYKIKFYITKSE